jgi:hypothetical protein
MSVEDMFAMFVRLGGLTCVVFAVFDLVHVGALALGLPYPSRYGFVPDLLGAAVWGMVGVALLLGAGLITRLAYGRQRMSN